MSTTEQIIEQAKLDLLAASTDTDKFKEVLRQFEAKELKSILEFFWDFIIRESQTAKTKYSAKNIIESLEPTSKYQQRERCKEPLGYCTISMCVRIDPACAVKRITGIMLSLRVFIQTLLTERPELLTSLPVAASSQPEQVEAAATSKIEAPLQSPVSEAKPIAALKEQVVSKQMSPAPESTSPSSIDDPHGQTAADQIKGKFEKYRDKLWEMVEFEGLDHAFIMTKEGHVLQTASASRNEFEKIAQTISHEIESIIEQGEAASFSPLLTVTKEFSNSVLAIRSLGNHIYLVGVSATVLPGKIHSLIVRLGEHLKLEMSIAEKMQT